MNGKRLLPVIITAAAGVMLSLWGFFFLQGREQQVLEANFRSMARDQVATVEREIQANLEVLESLRAFYSAVPGVGFAEFTSFVQPLLQQHQTIQALEWIPRIPLEKRGEYVSQARRHFPQFEITERQAQGVMVPAGTRSEYFPVYHVAPYKGNEAALGFDLASNQTRLQALEAARASGHATATARITLVQEDANQFGFLVFSPVYEAGELQTADNGSGSLKGFVLAVYRIGNMIEKSLSYLAEQPLSIRIEDRGSDTAADLLFGPKHPEPPLAGLAYQADVAVADRRWTIRCTATAELLAGYDTTQSWFFLVAALLFTTAAAGFVGVSRNREVRVAELVGARTRELSASKRVAEKRAEELSEANQELEQFAYAASHDLQEPVRTLVSFSSLLRDDLGDELSPEAATDLKHITNAARRMQRLIRDLLALSRASRSALQMADVALEDCLGDSLNALRERVTETGARVEQVQLPVVSGDRRLLTQLFQNLLSNAMKFQRGDVAPVITIAAEQQDSMWLVEVKDNGIGVEQEYADQIFAPFKRLHRMEDYEGSGVGLAICRRAVERHGGRIWVESKPGDGSRFQFTLPAEKRNT